MLQIDFTDVKVIEPIPVGTYQVLVTNAEAKEGKEFPYVSWEMSVEGGEFEGRKLWNNTSTSPKALFKLKEALIALGADPATLGGAVSFDPQDYVGASCMVVVDVQPRTDNGESRNVITKMLPLPTGAAASKIGLKPTVKFH
jgi:hypothetical protein